MFILCFSVRSVVIQPGRYPLAGDQKFWLFHLGEKIGRSPGEVKRAFLLLHGTRQESLTASLGFASLRLSAASC